MEFQLTNIVNYCQHTYKDFFFKCEISLKRIMIFFHIRMPNICKLLRKINITIWDPFELIIIIFIACFAAYKYLISEIYAENIKCMNNN